MDAKTPIREEPQKTSEEHSEERGKTCCFFGHKQIYDEERILTAILTEKIELLIAEGFNNFLFGGYGRFDSLGYKAVKALKAKHSHIKMIFVQAYYKPNDPGMEHLRKSYDETVYPGIEEKPLKFAIVYRNQKMVDWSDFCIFYVKQSYGGANQALQYAKRKKKKLLNIGERLYEM